MKGCDVVGDVQRTLFHNAKCFDAWAHKQRVDVQSNLCDVEVTSREPDVTVTTHNMLKQIVINTSPVQCANVHVRRDIVRRSAFSKARGQLNFVGDSRKVPSCSIMSRKRWVRVDSVACGMTNVLRFV